MLDMLPRRDSEDADGDANDAAAAAEVGEAALKPGELELGASILA